MSGISINGQGLQFIFACFEKYSGTWLYWVLSVLALLVVIFYKNKEGKFLFGWYPFVLLLTVYNPFLMNRLIEKLDFEAEYYRFFWLLPINFLLAYALVESAGRLTAFWKKAVLVLCAAVLVLSVNQDSLRPLLSVSIPENVYKAEDDLLMVCEIIHGDSGEEQPKAALPLEYNLQARQYDPSLKLSIERNKMLYFLGTTTVGTYSENNKRYAYQAAIMKVIYAGQNIEPSALKKALKATKTDYLVAYKSFPVHDTILAAGCTPIGDTPDSVVYLTAYGAKHNQK